MPRIVALILGILAYVYKYSCLGITWLTILRSQVFKAFATKEIIALYVFKISDYFKAHFFNFE